MATVTITITDRPGGAMITCESKNPPIPMASDGNPELENLTDAQAVGIGAIMAICEITGHSEFRTLLT